MKSGAVAVLLCCLSEASAFTTAHGRRKAVSSVKALPDSISLPDQSVSEQLTDQLKSVAEAFSSALPDASEASSGGDLDAIAASVASFPDSAILAAVAGAVLIGGTAMTSSKTDKTSKKKDLFFAGEPGSEPDPIDVSIPYDAAAGIAYCSFKGIGEIKDTSEYEQFKSAYESYTVAEVSLKKQSRDFERLKATMTATSE